MTIDSPQPTRDHLCSQAKAFALVSVLLMIALMMALVIGLLSMARLEYADSRRALDQYVAKANAKFAAKIALSELQISAGPDQAATATARLVDSLDDPVVQPHWTGVWNYADVEASDTRDLSKCEEVRGHAETKGPTWLVSRADLSSTPSPQDAIDEGIEIAEVQRSDNSVEVVEVEPFELSNNGGKVAWWVSDEGVKAQVSPAADQSDTRLQETLRRQRTP